MKPVYCIDNIFGRLAAAVRKQDAKLMTLLDGQAVN